MNIFKRLFCKHTYIYLGRFKCFRQSPFHEPWVGWVYKTDLKECTKCGKKVEFNQDFRL